MLTRRMLVLEMISEFIAAISVKVTVRTLKTPEAQRCLDASLRVYSLPHSRKATLSFLFSDGVSRKVLRIFGRFRMSQIFLIKRVE